MSRAMIPTDAITVYDDRTLDHNAPRDVLMRFTYIDRFRGSPGSGRGPAIMIFNIDHDDDVTAVEDMHTDKIEHHHDLTDALELVVEMIANAMQQGKEVSIRFKEANRPENVKQLYRALKAKKLYRGVTNE